MFSMFLLSYRNTCESLGEFEKAVETIACQLVFPLPNFQSCLYNRIETQNIVSYFLITECRSKHFVGFVLVVGITSSMEVQIFR